MAGKTFDFYFSLTCTSDLDKCPKTDARLDKFVGKLGEIRNHFKRENRQADQIVLKAFDLYSSGNHVGATNPDEGLPSGERYPRTVFVGLAEGPIFAEDGTMVAGSPDPDSPDQPLTGQEQFRLFLREIFEYDISEEGEPKEYLNPTRENGEPIRNWATWVIFRLPEHVSINSAGFYVMGGKSS